MTDQNAGEDQQPETPQPAEGRQTSPVAWLALVLLGIIIVTLTVALSPASNAEPAPPVQAATSLPTPFIARFNIQSQAEGQRVEREAVAVTTPLPTLTPYLTPTSAPVTPIPWSEEDLNALTWLCYEEVRGMREVRYDACLSVISTVRRRYAYDDDPYHEDTIAETLLRENQFPIDFDPAQPAPDEFFREVVDAYQWGARGSCNGYLYYDSVSGGPSLCVIRAANGQFVEFHNGWR